MSLSNAEIKRCRVKEAKAALKRLTKIIDGYDKGDIDIDLWYEAMDTAKELLDEYLNLDLDDRIS